MVEEIDDVLPHRQLSTQQEQQLHERRRDCEGVLKDLNDILDRNVSLGDQKTVMKDRKFHVAWKRLRWDQTEVQELRHRLHLSINGLNLFLQNLTSDKVFEMGKQISDLHLREEAHEKELRRKGVLEYFSTFDHASSQQDVFRKRNPQTGEWILKSNEFTDFEDNKMKTLLCHGMPGAGKTIMASIVIDHFFHIGRNDHSIGVCYFYFRYDSTVEQTLEVVAGSLVRQLLEQRTALPSEIESVVERRGNKQAAHSLKEIFQSFEVAAKMYSKVFIILDALDEYYTGDSARCFELFNGLKKLQEKGNIQLFATTRINSEIIMQFTPCLRTEIRAHDDDVRIYINSRMHELRKARENSDLRIEVVDKVVQATGGMYESRISSVSSMLNIQVSPSSSPHGRPERARDIGEFQKALEQSSKWRKRTQGHL